MCVFNLILQFIFNIEVPIQLIDSVILRHQAIINRVLELLAFRITIDFVHLFTEECNKVYPSSLCWCEYSVIVNV